MNAHYEMDASRHKRTHSHTLIQTEPDLLDIKTPHREYHTCDLTQLLSASELSLALIIDDATDFQHFQFISLFSFSKSRAEKSFMYDQCRGPA